MIRILLPIMLFSACSRTELAVDGAIDKNVIIVSKGRYKIIRGAEDLLRKVSSATLMITFKQEGKQKTVQDMISFSIGGKEEETSSSRLGLRIDREGYLMGIARARDNETVQIIRSRDRINSGSPHTAALTVDFQQNEMLLFLDGERLETIGRPAFTATQTEDTSSINSALGAEDDGSDSFFEGELSDPKIWRRKLSEEEIKKAAVKRPSE